MTMGVHLMVSFGAEKHRVLIRDQQRNSQRHTFPCLRQTKKSNLKILESGADFFTKIHHGAGFKTFQDNMMGHLDEE